MATINGMFWVEIFIAMFLAIIILHEAIKHNWKSVIVMTSAAIVGFLISYFSPVIGMKLTLIAILIVSIIFIAIDTIITKKIQ